MQSSKKSGISRNSIIKTAAAAPQVPAAKHTLVTFQIQSKPGSKVYIAGDFNEWNPMEQEFCDHDNNGVYQIAVELKPGTYEYKFHINESWCVDPGNPNFTRNPMGTLNSVITVE
jgi:1,4-alpha-glucan branching enzyme